MSIVCKYNWRYWISMSIWYVSNHVLLITIILNIEQSNVFWFSSNSDHHIDDWVCTDWIDLLVYVRDIICGDWDCWNDLSWLRVIQRDEISSVRCDEMLNWARKPFDSCWSFLWNVVINIKLESIKKDIFESWIWNIDQTYRIISSCWNQQIWLRMNFQIPNRFIMMKIIFIDQDWNLILIWSEDINFLNIKGMPHKNSIWRSSIKSEGFRVTS